MVSETTDACWLCCSDNVLQTFSIIFQKVWTLKVFSKVYWLWHVSKPEDHKIIFFFCWHLSFLTCDWLFKCNKITFWKYFWYSWFWVLQLQFCLMFFILDMTVSLSALGNELSSLPRPLCVIWRLGRGKKRNPFSLFYHPKTIL